MIIYMHLQILVSIELSLKIKNRGKKDNYDEIGPDGWRPFFVFCTIVGLELKQIDIDLKITQI